MRPQKRAATLPELRAALTLTVAEYMRFLREGAADSKEFGARHTAAKAALAHIDQLMKLSGEDDGVARQLIEHQLLIGEMRQEMSEETQDDDGEPC